MKHVAVILALVALAGCGNGKHQPDSPFSVTGNIDLSIDGTYGFVLGLLSPSIEFIDTSTPVNTDVHFYVNGSKKCSFNVFLQTTGIKNEYIITLDYPLYQEPFCRSLEKSFLLQMTADHTGVLITL